MTDLLFLGELSELKMAQYNTRACQPTGMNILVIDQEKCIFHKQSTL